MKRNIKIIIEYDGTNYGGWQRQKSTPSIQESIEEGLLKLTGERIVLNGAGRTDSGVHARGQVANFFTKASSIPSNRFGHALNAVTPYDIKILESQEMPDKFHSRYCARARHYRYSIVNRSAGVAIGRDYYYHIPVSLDKEAMKKALNLLKGSHDFKSFQSKGSGSKTSHRTIYDIRLSWKDPFLYLDIIGSGFLHNMVRIITGTLVHIGRGKMNWNRMDEIISARDRSLAGPTVPSQGLCLEKVYYKGKTNDFVLDTLGSMY